MEQGAGHVGEQPADLREGFKKPARDHKGHENTYADRTTKRRVALCWHQLLRLTSSSVQNQLSLMIV